MGLGAWETTLLHALGRWDEAASAFARLEIAWEEAGRPSAGYAAHGFLAALDVGRARRDDALIDRARGGFESILDEIPALAVEKAKAETAAVLRPRAADS